MQTIYTVGIFPDRGKTFLSLLASNYRVITSKRSYPFWPEESIGIEFMENILNEQQMQLTMDDLTEFEWYLNQFAVFTEKTLSNLLGGNERKGLSRQEFSALRNMAFSAFAMVEQFRKLASEVPIDLVISSADFSAFRRPLVMAARELGIPTLGMEYGHPGAFPEPDVYFHGYHFISHDLLISDYVNFDSELDRQILQPLYNAATTKQTLLALGIPSDSEYTGKISRQEAASFLAIDPEKFTVTIAGSWYPIWFPSRFIYDLIQEGEIYETIFQSLSRIPDKDQLQLIIKLHFLEPNVLQDTRSFFGRLAEKYQLKIDLITRDHLNQILACSDLMIGSNRSSIYWDAFLASVPVVVFPTASFLASVRKHRLNQSSFLCRNGCMRYVFTTDELKNAIQCYREKRQYQEFKKKVKILHKDKRINFDSAQEKSQKICEWINQTLNKNRATECNPIASVIIVTYNSAETIRDCLNSVLSYTDVKIDVIVIDNNSIDDTRSILKEFKDHIKTIFNNENKGFSFACNQGIRTSKGKYVVLLNPDTIVTPGWLNRMINHFSPDVGAVGPVSDYVAGLQKVERYVPPDIPEKINLLELAKLVAEKNRSRNQETKLLVGFCLVLSRHALDTVGWLDENLFLGNDDLDLCWRLRLRGYKLLVATDVFVHHKGQVSFKTDAEERTNRLIQESSDSLYAKLEKYYGPGNVPPPHDLWGINWFQPSHAHFKKSAEPDTAPLTSIIILTHNQLADTRLCLESLEKYTSKPFELILVDNGSRDGTVAFLQEYVQKNPHARAIINCTNKGFAAGNNQGLVLAKGDYIVLLNNDTVVTEGWLERMLEIFREKPEIGIIGPMSNYVSGRQLVKDVPYRSLEGMQQFARKWKRQHRGEVVEIPRVVGFCLVTRRAVVDRIGGLEERFGYGNFEDDDFCIRAAFHGYKACIARDVFIHHTGSQTFQGANIDYVKSMEKNWEIFKRKWHLPPNLSLGAPYAINLHPGELAQYRIPISREKVLANHVPDENGRWWHEKRQGSDDFERHLVQGERLFQEGKFAEAEKLFTSVLRTESNNSRARNDLACLLWQTGRMEDAAKEFKRAMELDPEDRDVVWNSGQFLLATGFVEEAVELYSSYLKRNPEEQEIKQVLNQLLQEQGAEVE